jgi:hypothetical protein
MMEPAMLDGVPQRACDWFLTRYFVKRLRAPLASNYLIGHLVLATTFQRFLFVLLSEREKSSAPSGSLKICSRDSVWAAALRQASIR